MAGSGSEKCCLPPLPLPLPPDRSLRSIAFTSGFLEIAMGEARIRIRCATPFGLVMMSVARHMFLQWQRTGNEELVIEI